MRAGDEGIAERSQSPISLMRAGVVVEFELVLGHIPKQGDFPTGSDVRGPRRFTEATQGIVRQREFVFETINVLSGTHEGICT